MLLLLRSPAQTKVCTPILFFYTIDVQINNFTSHQRILSRQGIASVKLFYFSEKL